MGSTLNAGRGVRRKRRRCSEKRGSREVRESAARAPSEGDSTHARTERAATAKPTHWPHCRAWAFIQALFPLQTTTNHRSLRAQTKPPRPASQPSRAAEVCTPHHPSAQRLPRTRAMTDRRHDPICPGAVGRSRVTRPPPSPPRAEQGARGAGFYRGGERRRRGVARCGRVSARVRARVCRRACPPGPPPSRAALSPWARRAQPMVWAPTPALPAPANRRVRRPDARLQIPECAPGAGAGRGRRGARARVSRCACIRARERVSGGSWMLCARGARGARG